MGRLEGKVALITGGAMELGESHARRFVEEGAKVIITDVMEELGRAVATSLGDAAIFLPHDVADSDAWEWVVAAGVKAFGPINVLVSNAGISGHYASTSELKYNDYHKVIAVNVNGVFYGMRTLIPEMLIAGDGSIINISSVAGFTHRNNSTNAAYAASKFAVRGLTKAASVEYAQHGIRVDSVHPGGVLTQMAQQNTPQDAIDAFVEALPIRRLGKPGEISNLVLFLASDESSYMTGAECVVDGGMLH